ncbi:MAG TPA: threonine synthase [Bacillota bacterium]|nr:threonine synthase [Clostridiaceae bacterium]HNR03419.1 threonine synthase [Bacillota bacterium]HNT02547.1 threonine synthase [Bacillota bacterium]HPA54497.1 threonine synthase [Bacillota bacterium]HPX69106.1 threonine synthase [Bacillota bacterium]
MSKVLKLKCVKCGREYNEAEILYTCRDCGIDGILDVELDYDSIRKELTREYLKNNKDYSLWRYLPAIPLEKTGGIQPLQVGWTPLYNIKSLSKETGLSSFFLKDDSRNPTASLKDRASAVGVAKAVELGRNVMCAASTGNAASSLSGFAAVAGIKTYIFVPETAPEAKVTQLLIYGSNVFLVKGTYDEAVELCFKAAEEFGWYNRSCAINPYLVEGKKTISYEICEQLDWKAPDIAVVAVGDGCTIGGVWKGFKECFELGLIDKFPKIVGVQAENSNPVTRAFNKKTYEFEYRVPDTLADSISVGIPRNGIKALNALHESGGYMVDVSDEEILAAMKILAQKTGVFGEPAGVTSFAGIMKMKELGLLKGDEKVVSIVSGSGLKDIKSAVKAAGKANHVEPDLNDLKRIVHI